MSIVLSITFLCIAVLHLTDHWIYPVMFVLSMTFCFLKLFFAIRRFGKDYYPENFKRKRYRISCFLYTLSFIIAVFYGCFEYFPLHSENRLSYLADMMESHDELADFNNFRPFLPLLSNTTMSAMESAIETLQLVNDMNTQVFEFMNNKANYTTEEIQEYISIQKQEMSVYNEEASSMANRKIFSALLFTLSIIFSATSSIVRTDPRQRGQTAMDCSASQGAEYI